MRPKNDPNGSKLRQSRLSKAENGENDPIGSLGDAVARRRKRLGLTQQDLADLAECGVAFVVRLENGKSTVRLDKLGDVLAALGLRLRLEAGKGGLTVDPGL